jgi:preprotein translocase SecE subunit
VAENTKEDSKRPKRRLRVSTGTGETVRERSEKVQQQAAAPKRPSRFKAFVGGFFWPLRMVGRGISKLGRFRVFRWIGYVLLPPYIRRSWGELRQVTWPGRRTTFQLVWAVIVFSTIFGVVVAIVDFGLDKLFKEIIVK